MDVAVAEPHRKSGHIAINTLLNPPAPLVPPSPTGSGYTTDYQYQAYANSNNHVSVSPARSERSQRQGHSNYQNALPRYGDQLPTQLGRQSRVDQSQSAASDPEWTPTSHAHRSYQSHISYERTNFAPHNNDSYGNHSPAPSSYPTIGSSNGPTYFEPSKVYPNYQYSGVTIPQPERSRTPLAQNNHSPTYHQEPQTQSHRQPGNRERQYTPTATFQTSARASTRLVALADRPKSSSPFPDSSPEASSSQKSTTGSKRRSPDEGEYAPQAKRAKKQSSKSTAPTTKRGFHASKRREVAQLTAQDGVDYSSTVAYKHIPNSDKKKTGELLTERIIRDRNHEAKYQPVLQNARCMSNKYRDEEFSRCVSCTRRWAGDTCRFQGVCFAGKRSPDEPQLEFPTDWNVPLTDEHILLTRITTARALLNVLKEELMHLQDISVIYRKRETEVRATCDTCMTSLFCGSWMCRVCGREACGDCFATIKHLTEERPDASPEQMADINAQRDKHANANPFFLNCTKRNDHTIHCFSPVSRFSQEELQAAIDKMLGVLTDAEATGQLPVLTPNELDSTPPSAEAAEVEEIPFHEIKRFTKEQLVEDVFRRHWATGLPLLVSGLSSDFTFAWSPEYFTQEFGDQGCLIIECQTDINKRVTISDFFNDFGQYQGRTERWKLKDWPPSSDFQSSYPALFNDFSSVVPMPNYVRRDGAMNISSHFPSNTISPDLGPKMYNAMASNELKGSKGSTKLHMDMSDALNIMTYASPKPDGTAGCAVWDLYQPSDSDKIRQFLRGKFKGTLHDPIHGQQHYLDEELRRELWLQFGVKSIRVYQQPGEAIFIPAGCAHQVCNLSDCIKVAIDFVSPENIARCEKLTTEFREQNQRKAWKEDVLQLRTMMWFAWLSCEQLLESRAG